MALCAAVIIAALVEGRWWMSRVLSLRPLQAIGQVSYGTYIWHLPIFVAVDRVGGGWTASERIGVGSPARPSRPSPPGSLSSDRSSVGSDRGWIRHPLRPRTEPAVVGSGFA